MDLRVMIVGLIIAMAVSGGVLGAFWLRALTIMRRRIIDSSAEVERLAGMVNDIREQVEGLHADDGDLRERLEIAERFLESGDPPSETEESTSSS